MIASLLTTFNAGAVMKRRGFFALCVAILGVACGDNLASLNGPTSGTVSGLVCSDLPSLTAAIEFPIVENTFISEGKCLKLSRRKGVKVLRTVMLPGDGKYSQFEIVLGGNTTKLWIRTKSIRQSS